MSIHDAINILSSCLPEAGRLSLLTVQPDIGDQQLDFMGGSLWNVKSIPKLRTIFQRRMVGEGPQKTAWCTDCIRFLDNQINESKHSIWQAYHVTNGKTDFYLIDTISGSVICSRDYFEDEGKT